jgi:hypothetical protein
MNERMEIRDNKQETLVYENVRMMNNEMLEVLAAESLGGNAGDMETSENHVYICATANGYVDTEGKIIVFGNFQNIPKEISESNKGFSFNVAFKPDMTIHKIVDVEDKDRMGEHAHDVLNRSVELFNKEHEK